MATPKRHEKTKRPTEEETKRNEEKGAEQSKSNVHNHIFVTYIEKGKVRVIRYG